MRVLSFEGERTNLKELLRLLDRAGLRPIQRELFHHFGICLERGEGDYEGLLRYALRAVWALEEAEEKGRLLNYYLHFLSAWAKGDPLDPLEALRALE